MLAFAVLSLGVASSALAWPAHPRHNSLARTIQARQAPVATTKAPVASTWFASWHAADFPLSNVSWNKYTIVTYSFALTTPDVNAVNITDPDVFKDFVSTAHANNCSAAISVGGWTGSQYFSTAVATAENRTAFVKTMTNLVKDNNLDGLDFDWEYPGLAGIGCNTKSANDTSNFLAFLTELRTALPNTTFSAATSLKPFMSSDLTTPSTNVSAFSSVLDYIAIMNYDVWGPWSATVGPNAPLNDTCATNTTQQVGSAVSAVEAWTTAGMPADQIVLAVAAYGHGFSVPQAEALGSDGAVALYAPFNKSATPGPGDVWDTPPAAGEVDVCGNPEAQGGTWNFWGLVEGGFLNENGTANTAGGIGYKYDECSQTPVVYNKTSGVMVAFDDATSFAAKGSFIKSIGLRGFAMWEAGGDYDDILLDSIRTAVGFATPDQTGDDGCAAEGDPNSSEPSAPAPSVPVAAPAPSAPAAVTTSHGGKAAATTKTHVGGGGAAATSKAPAAAAAEPTRTVAQAAASASVTHSKSAAAASPSASADPDVDDEDCEDDEDPETTSSAPTSSTKTASAAAATATDDGDDCDDEEY